MVRSSRLPVLLAGLLAACVLAGCAAGGQQGPAQQVAKPVPAAAPFVRAGHLCATLGQGQADLGAVKKDVGELLRGARVYCRNCERQGVAYSLHYDGTFDTVAVSESRLAMSGQTFLDFKELVRHSLRFDIKTKAGDSLTDSLEEAITSGKTGDSATVSLVEVMAFGFSDADKARCVFEELRLIKKAEAEEAVSEFQPLAAQYRAMSPKPAVSEEQRKYVVQANSMAQDKQYARAISLYNKALEVNPLSFPAAYFNLALLEAQQGNILGAILNMRKYLLLVPQADDARSAQDKIYEWQAKVGE